MTKRKLESAEVQVRTPEQPSESQPQQELRVEKAERPETLGAKGKRFSIPHISHSGLWMHLILLGIVFAFFAAPQVQLLLQQHVTLAETESHARLVQDAAEANATSQSDTPDVLNGTVLQNALLPEDGVVQFVEVLESAAERTNVTQHVELLSGRRVVQRGVVTIPAQLSVTGAWDDVVKFVGELEQSNLYLNVTAVDIAANSQQSHDTAWTISATTFWKQAL